MGEHLASSSPSSHQYVRDYRGFGIKPGSGGDFFTQITRIARDPSFWIAEPLERLELSYFGSARKLFQFLAEEPGAIWFHSGLTPRAGHRWEWCSAWPSERYTYLGQGRVQLKRGERVEIARCDDFFQFLATRVRPAAQTELPFSSGLAGHLDYELGYELQNISSRHPLRTHLACVDRYDWSLVVDHQDQRSWLMVHDHCPDNIRKRAQLWLSKRDLLTDIQPRHPALRWESRMQPRDYLQRFEQLQQYILDGDIYQANLTRQWQARLPKGTTDWSLYQELIKQVPAPYSVYHKAEDHTLLSVSPERFLTIENGRITTQPIKGTRPRGLTDSQDRALALELTASEKDRAENLMIVDLLRNDLSRNAAIGSVKVPDLFKLESYSNVHHLVSTVTARLKDGATALDALRDAFPGGSITGAPKRRAMQVIDELELAARGSYCGSAFWFSDDGHLDSNILIRSLIRQQDSLLCSGGGGIVADSEGEAEYQESATKVKQLLEALGKVE